MGCNEGGENMTLSLCISNHKFLRPRKKYNTYKCG